MEYTERLENVTVLGAAGKMGSGILLLTALEMADLSLKPGNKNKQFVLNAVDVSHQALSGLMKFLKAQTIKAAEKKTVALRKVYEDRTDLIENQDIIDQYVFDVMNIVRPVTTLEAAYQSTMIFEAIKEDPELKVKIFTQVDKNNKKNPWYFTNTSSIPIHELDEKAGLGGRIIGFHFYNPPAVQRLVELIQARGTDMEIVEFARQYAKNLKKVIVPANDFAGFIGNGHFMRDGLHGISEVQRLTETMPFVEAVFLVNKVSQDYLIRPMGIFQLIDYVGLDVCQYIMSVMNPYLPDEDLHSDLLDQFISMGILGGQFADGSQKDGFLKYEKGRPAGIYDPVKKAYVSFAEIQAVCDEKLGPLPQGAPAWKTIVGNPDKEEVLQKYFQELIGMKTLGAELAGRYGKRSKQIGLKLVADKVANNEEDVNNVLLTGFYHAYGPINNYFES
ncbi:MAG: 3-hydroxyacyl-CoA dehydrogenase family protein [Acidobacteria bacterium]|jgi:3-hydroxyacyl-CoA dehydrogenase|nr:3-hydroxyacyl-CoA dehydrogenase family protein [Acidobacteriota bacterium]